MDSAAGCCLKGLMDHEIAKAIAKLIDNIGDLIFIIAFLTIALVLVHCCK